MRVKAEYCKLYLIYNLVPHWVMSLAHLFQLALYASPVPQCGGRFTLLVNWGLSDSCAVTYRNKAEQLDVLNEQHKKWNTVLYVYTSWPANENCTLEAYSSLKERRVNIKNMLNANGFLNSDISPLRRLKHTAISDVLRMVIMFETGLAYTDLDVIYTKPPSFYHHSAFVVAPVWHETGAAVEIQNSAMCLPRNACKTVLHWQRARVRKKGGNRRAYSYTELGPVALQHTMQTFGSIRIFPTINPYEAKSAKIKAQVQSYGGFYVYHVCGAIRNHYKGRYALLVNSLLAL